MGKKANVGKQSLLVVPDFKENKAGIQWQPHSSALWYDCFLVAWDMNLCLLPATWRKHELDLAVCLSVPSVAVVKATWEERVYSAFTSTAQFIPEGSQGRNSRSWRHQMTQRPWRNTAYLLPRACLASFLISSRTTDSEMALPQVGQTFWHQPLIKKRPNIFLAYRQYFLTIYSIRAGAR